MANDGDSRGVVGMLADAVERPARSPNDVLAVVSHDLRTPLSVIATNADLLERAAPADESGAKIRKRTDLIQRSVDRMTRLLADLLDVASIDAGRLSLQPETLSVEALVHDLHDTFEASAAARGLTFEASAAKELPPISVDRHRIVQSLGNILSNAIKLTPEGGQVRLRAEAAGPSEIRFVISDTGPGIAPELRPRIFERFVRGSSREGHGLGLAIAKGIIDTHGGSVRVESEPGQGATFLVSLPLASPPVRRIEDERFVQGGGECGALIRAFDWSKTGLGAMATWPSSLRTSVSTMLRSPYPITMFWGPELNMLYNDPFRPIHGEKHPATMGASAPKALAEAWPLLGPLVQQTLTSGEPMFIENGLVMFARRPGGLKEEAYFTWSYNPTIDENGEVAGLFAIASETTRQVVGDRRLVTLRELSLRTAYDRKVESVFRSMQDVLAQGAADVPFSLFYVVTGAVATLVSASGIASDHAAAAPGTWPLEEVASSGQERLLEDLAATHGELPGGPWPEPTTRALLLQVPMGADTETMGVLVAGLNPMQTLDAEYRSFLQLLARQISASIASARAYEEEAARVEKLAALDRAKTDFFSNVSHEFRTPLTLILGPLEDALGRSSPVLEGKSLELVRRNAVRLQKMVNSLLDFSRVEAGRAQATFVPVDLAAFTEGLASHFQSAAASAGLELGVDCPPLPELVYVDPEMWEKIVLNLLSNAVKYTRRGRIDLRLRADEKTVIVTVADTGVGIAEDELPRVFDRFYRVRESDGRSHEGTGIGLALTRQLVELHGGMVDISSRLGEGTTLTVKIPRGAAHLAADRIGTSAERPMAVSAAAFVEEAARWTDDTTDASSAPSVASEPAAASSRILLVDDNSDLRSYVAGVLGRFFPNIETAANGADALERIRATLPDLVLSDVMMPVMDGFEMIRELRRDPKTRSLPIILLSARAGDEPKVEGLDSGADDYLVKPFSARELVARVRTQLEMARVRAEVGEERGKVEELRRSAAARDEFIAVSSHELRTPLTALQAQIEGLQRLAEKEKAELPTARLTTKLSVALRQTERLTRLVESLLDSSRVAQGALELERDEVDLGSLVRACVSRFEEEARASGTKLELDAVRATGRWDAKRLDQVVGNLLANAIKHAPGTTIEVTVKTAGARATLRVRDHGSGIPDEALARVFGRFERAASTEHHGGFGIGLFLSRAILEAHGGTIEASQTPGHGTTITVTLPCEDSRDP